MVYDISSLRVKKPFPVAYCYLNSDKWRTNVQCHTACFF